MRVTFSTVFKKNSDGSYSPKKIVEIGGVKMGPGVTFNKGVSFSGFDLAKLAGSDLEIEYLSDNSIRINGIYKQ